MNIKIAKSQAFFTVIALIFVGFLIFLSSPREKKKEVLPEKKEGASQQKPIEVFSVAGVITKIDGKENYLLVKKSGEEKEIKVILSEDTEIVQLKFPFDLKNPPKEATFTPERIPITISDLKIGDNILIETTINIYAKTEFNNVSRLQVLP